MSLTIVAKTFWKRTAWLRRVPRSLHVKECLFCAIAAGRIPSAELYQDERVFAFLDINPLRPGHALVVTKAHAAKLEDAPPEDAAALAQAARLLAPALCRATRTQDSTIAINNGPDAGQEVHHVHLHIVPRTKSDGAGPIHALFGSRPRMSSNELHDIAVQVQAQLAPTQAGRGHTGGA
jgi:histidine triad (HIT) family protein